jgi:hypothetical protein
MVAAFEVMVAVKVIVCSPVSSEMPRPVKVTDPLLPVLREIVPKIAPDPVARLAVMV